MKSTGELTCDCIKNIFMTFKLLKKLAYFQRTKKK